MRQATVDNPRLVLIPRLSRRHPEYKLSNLDYADDIAMLLSSIPDAQKFLDRLVLAALDVVSISMLPKPKSWFSIFQGDLPCELTTSTLTSQMTLNT